MPSSEESVEDASKDSEFVRPKKIEYLPVDPLQIDLSDLIDSKFEKAQDPDASSQLLISKSMSRYTSNLGSLLDPPESPTLEKGRRYKQSDSKVSLLSSNLKNSESQSYFDQQDYSSSQNKSISQSQAYPEGQSYGESQVLSASNSLRSGEAASQVLSLSSQPEFSQRSREAFPSHQEASHLDVSQSLNQSPSLISHDMS